MLKGSVYMNNALNFNKTDFYTKYVIANFAKEFFKSKIKELDVNHEYNRITGCVMEVAREDVDKWKEENISEETKAKYESLLKEWRDEHKDYYRMQPCLPSSENFAKFEPEEKNFEGLTLNDAIQGYKAANETLKTIKNSDLDEYCIEIKPMLNYEHRQEYNDFVASLKSKLGIPTDDEIKRLLPEKEITKYRISLDRKPCEDASNMDLYAEIFLKNIAADGNSN